MNLEEIIKSEKSIVKYPKKVYFASSNNFITLLWERPEFDLHIVNLAINAKLGNANKVTDIIFTNNLSLRNQAYNNNIVNVTYQNNIPTYEFLVQNDDNTTFTCYVANPFWGENSKIYCYGDFVACFKDCSLLEKISLKNFNTDNVTRFSDAFLYCRAIKTLDLEHLVLPQNLTELVYGCSKLVRLKLKLPANANLSGAFHNCVNLRYLNIFENAINLNASYMFNQPMNLKSVYFKNTTFSNTKKLFYNARGFVRIFCETLNFQDDLTFKDCFEVKGGNGTTYDANHIDSEYARIDGENGLPGYFTDPADAIKITLINVDNEGYTDEIYLCAGDTYTIPALDGYTAVVTDNNGNSYSDGDTITINQDITLTFVWSAVNNNE